MNFFSTTNLRIKTLLSAVALLGLASSGNANLITNGGFEETALLSNGSNWQMSPTAAPGWSTTSPDHQIEIWTDGFMGVSAFEGTQFNEINANQKEAIYQDISGLASGLDIDFSFAHRGRLTTESMRFTITDLGIDGLYGTADDTTLFSKIYSDGVAAWGYYTNAGAGPILALGNTVRVAFEALTDGSYGNFLDAVEVNAAPAQAPEPGTWAAILLLFCATYGSAMYRKLRPRASLPH